MSAPEQAPASPPVQPPNPPPATPPVVPPAEKHSSPSPAPNQPATSNRNRLIAAVAGLILAAVVGVPVTKLVTGPAADPPKVTLDTSLAVQLYDELDIDAKVPAGVVFSWIVPKQPGMTFRSSGASGFFFAQKTGVYYVGIAWMTPAGIDKTWCEVTVTITKPAPPPIRPPFKPPVTPQPPPPEQPASFMIGVVDANPTTSRDVMVAFISDQTLNDRMGKGKHVFEWVDRTGNDAFGKAVPEMAPWVKAAFVKPLPWVYIVERQTNVLRWDGPLPKTPAELNNKLMEIGG